MKKRKRYLIAGLAMIAVTAASTMAYFTSTATIGDTNGGSPLQLNITNGNVEITANPGTGTTTPNWTYDVARSSSDSAYSYLIDTASITAYELKNRSIDMSGLGGTKSEDGRWPIGAPVTGAVTLARPGDAFVMGQAIAGVKNGTISATTGTDSGLTIKNTSNLTVKVKMTASTDATNTFTALTNAGWVFYLGEKGQELTPVTTTEGLQTKLDTILSGVIAPKATKVVDIRLELPLTAGNAYNSTSTPISVSGFNLNNLFTIKATQENNPKWNEAGTV